jgi:hypothetical protein
VLVAVAAFAGPALADPSVPTGLTAVAVSDHEVDLSWSWPAPPDAGADLQLWRDGAELIDLDPASLTFVDSVPSPSTSYSYTLVVVENGSSTSVGPAAAMTRQDLPNAPTGVAVAFNSLGSTIATITWTRGAMDADVTYNITAQQVGGTATTTVTHNYPAGDATPGSATIDTLLSYGTYRFTVSAVETAEPPTDPGGTVPAPAAVQVQAPDIVKPTFSSPVVTTTRTSVGAATVSWSSASDQGSGVASYAVCVDAVCQTVPYDPLASTVAWAFTGIPSNGAQHPVTVTATDASGNVSSVLTASVFMDALQPPAISLAPGLGDGCSPLTYQLVPTPIDGSNSTLVLFVNGVQWPGGSVGVVSGAQLPPFSLVQLTAQASFGSDVSPISPPISVRVGDPDAPSDPPVLHGVASSASSSETLSWDPLTATGAPVTGYRITSANVPGYTGGGVTIPQTSAPQLPLPGLAQNTTYAVQVAAIDACQNAGPSTEIKFSISDNLPPTTPRITAANPTSSSVALSWTGAGDNVQVEGYQIWRGTQQIADVGPNTTTYTDEGLPDSTSVTYKVRAYDTAGNFGSFSDPKSVATADGTPPTPPVNPIAKVGRGTATITWHAAFDAVGVVRYLVYRGTGALNATPLLLGTATATSFVDKNVPAGNWQWTVIAQDAAGNSSKPRSTPLMITTASIKAVAATSVKVISASGVRLLRYGGKSGVRLLLTFTLSKTVVPAELNLRVLSGTAKVKVSLPTGTGRTTPGKRIAERRAKKGTLVIPLGKMPQGKVRLIVTASQGKMVTLTAPKTAKKPTLSQK